MSIKKFGGLLFANYIVRKTNSWANNPVETQKKVFSKLIAKAASTTFGRIHDFKAIRSHQDFVKRVPVRDYEGLRNFFEETRMGNPDVLWPGKPLYLAKTSGTTSGTKYIPITSDSISNHINSARNALLHYIHDSGNASFVDGKLIFLQGSPRLHEENGIQIGRLSGIAAHYVPGYLQRNRLPSWETNCIEAWEEKVDKIVQETIHEDMRLISGIPPWVQMYLEKILEVSGKPNIKSVFPNLSLFVTGGVAYEPYRAKFENLFGGPIDKVELFPASEGFFAYQDKQSEPGMLLLLDSGIFYEFIPAEQFFDENPPRLTIGEVALGVNYVMIVSSNAGLWAYNLGDTIQFISKDPYRIIVSGRIKHFISAFGEHVIGVEVEKAIQAAAAKYQVELTEFTVAPQVTPTAGKLPYHEWFVASKNPPEDLNGFAALIDETLQAQNTYYRDLITGKILRPAVVRVTTPDAFIQYMKSQGKLGGQNKVPRLTNDRKIADALSIYVTRSSD
jgi:hypothetical protein